MMLQEISACLDLPSLLLCKSECQDEAKRISKEIEQRLRKDKKQLRREIKILLLGTSEAGKSTFLKQMRILNGAGFSESDRESYIPVILQNILTTIQTLIRAMKLLNIHYEFMENLRFVKCISRLQILSSEDFCRCLPQFQRFWQDPGIQYCYTRRREYHLADSSKYFLDQLTRIGTRGYLPNEQDILRTRVVTTGIVEYVFSCLAKRNRVIRMVDVGGQRSERRKWIHVFESVASIIFLVALSEYDQSLWESDQDNRLKESASLFSVIVRSLYFKDTSTILFLNKTDLFKEKIAMSHMRDYFPTYQGPPEDDIAARQFVLEMFQRLQPKYKKLLFFSHFTCATDTQNIKAVFNDVKETIFQNTLKALSLD